MKCVICEVDPLYSRWSDTHGVGVCTRCGMPYKFLFYDEQDKRIEGKEPEPALDQSGIELAKQYWAKKQMRVFPGVYDVLGISHRRGNRTYSGATEEEIGAFGRWYARHGPKKTGDELDDAIDENGGGFTM